MNPVTRIMTVALAAIALLIASALMDGPDEMQVQTDQAANLAELQTATVSRPDLLQAIEEAPPGSADEQAAAAAFCRHVKGPGAELFEVADGTMVCRGIKVMASAQGNSL